MRIAVEKPVFGSANRISAPYCSSMLRVIGNPNPIPCPRMGSTTVVVDSNGLNHRSPSATLTRWPVFSMVMVGPSFVIAPSALIVPPLPAALTALVNRFENTVVNSAGNIGGEVSSGEMSLMILISCLSAAPWTSRSAASKRSRKAMRLRRRRASIVTTSTETFHE